jgi:hypothetical protein
MTFLIEIFTVLKVWMIIKLSNQVRLEHEKAIFYNPQKDFFNGVLHVLITYHLIPILIGFVIESQILNLIPDLSFDHNSCILTLNE